MARASRAARASPLVTRPSLPVPAIWPASRLFSAAIRWAEGASTGSGVGSALGAAAYREDAPEV